MREKRVPWMCISGISVRNYLMEKTKNITLHISKADMGIVSAKKDDLVKGLNKDIEVDIIGAINAGLDAIHYDEKEKAEHKYKKIKKIGELKKLL